MKIKTITIFVSDILDENNDSAIKSEYVEYNEKGLEILNIDYDPSGKINSKILSQYNEKELLVTEHEFDTDNELIEKSVTEYDEKNRRQSEKTTYAYGGFEVKKYKHDDKNNTLEITLIDEDNAIVEREIIEIHAGEFVKTRTVFDENNEVVERYENEYDENNNIVQGLEYQSDKTLSVEKLFKFDDKQNLIERISKNGEGKVVEKVTISYDEKGRTIETNFSDQYLIVNEYNDEEKSHTEKRYRADKVIDTQIITLFDDDENPLEKITPTERIIYKYEFFEEGK